MVYVTLKSGKYFFEGNLKFLEYYLRGNNKKKYTYVCIYYILYIYYIKKSAYIYNTTPPAKLKQKAK